LGQGDPLVVREAFQEHRHCKRTGLCIIDTAIRQTGHERRDILIRDDAAIALLGDYFLR